MSELRLSLKTVTNRSKEGEEGLPQAKVKLQNHKNEGEEAKEGKGDSDVKTELLLITEQQEASKSNASTASLQDPRPIISQKPSL